MRTPRRFRLARAARIVINATLDWVRSFTLRDQDLYRGDRRFDNDAGAYVTPTTVMQLDAVWGCVRLLAETIAMLPLSIYQRQASGQKDIAVDHPLHFILHDQPNVDSTAVVFWEAMVAAMLLRGVGRAEKLMIGPKLVGLVFLSPDRLLANFDAMTGTWRYFYRQLNGQQREIPAARVWTIPGFSLDGLNGVSVVAYGAKVFGSAIAAEKAAARTFTSGMLQTVYYKVAGWLTKEQRQEFKDNVLGSVERGETPLLEGGTSADSIGLKPEDAQLLQTRQYGVEMICRWFRCDPSLVGHGDKVSNWGKGIETKMIGFLTFTLAPWLRRIEQAIGKDLLTPAERLTYYAKFALEGLLRADSAGRAAFYSTMVDHGIYTRDYCRELEDQPPMGGNAAKLTVQSAMVPLDALGTQAAPAPAAAAAAAREAILNWLRADIEELRRSHADLRQEHADLHDVLTATQASRT